MISQSAGRWFRVGFGMFVVQATFATLGGELPSTYQRVKYLRASTTQSVLGEDPYVDTGVVPHAKLHVTADVNVISSFSYWFGCWDAGFNSKSYALCNDGSGIYSAYGDGRWRSITPVCAEGAHTRDFQGG